MMTNMTDTQLRWMDKAEVADHIDDPEVLIAGRGLHDFFDGR
jgi:hypothetical protein